MYKIKVKNLKTNEIFWEYGFSKKILKKIHLYFNKTDEENYILYEILEIRTLIFTLKTFKKCLTNIHQTCYNEYIK